MDGNSDTGMCRAKAHLLGHTNRKTPAGLRQMRQSRRAPQHGGGDAAKDRVNRADTGVTGSHQSAENGGLDGCCCRDGLHLQDCGGLGLAARDGLAEAVEATLRSIKRLWRGRRRMARPLTAPMPGDPAQLWRQGAGRVQWWRRVRRHFRWTARQGPVAMPVRSGSDATNAPFASRAVQRNRF